MFHRDMIRSYKPYIQSIVSRNTIRSEPRGTGGVGICAGCKSVKVEDACDPAVVHHHVHSVTSAILGAELEFSYSKIVHETNSKLQV